MSSGDPAKTSTEEIREVGGSTPCEVVAAGKNDQIGIAKAPANISSLDPGTPGAAEAVVAAGNDNGSTMAMDISRDEGFQNQESSVSNGQVVESGKASENSEGAKPSSKILEDAEVLFRKGCDALASDDLVEAADCLSRALEIRVAHYGELAPECASTYYKYGCALLYKSQAESNVFNETATVAKKAGISSNSVKGETSNGDVKGKGLEGSANGVKVEGSIFLASDPKGKANAEESTVEGETPREEDAEEQDNDDEDAGENAEEEIEEEESDLDLAWKTLDIARVILEKQSGETVEKVDVRTALGDVSLEREDFETCLSDYFKALSGLEGLVESDSRLIAELCFKICLAFQLANKTGDALVYCQRARSICESRFQRLVKEIDGTKCGTTSKSDEGEVKNGNGDIEKSAEEKNKENEIEGLKQLLIDLSEKIDDLKQMISSAPIFDIAHSLNAKLASRVSNTFLGGNSSQESTTEGTGFDLPTSAITANGGVTHLGVVGRGVKRAAPIQIDASQSAIKRHSIDPASCENPEPSLSEPALTTQSSLEEAQKFGKGNA